MKSIYQQPVFHFNQVNHDFEINILRCIQILRIHTSSWSANTRVSNLKKYHAYMTTQIENYTRDKDEYDQTSNFFLS